MWTRRMCILLLLDGLFCVWNRSSWLLNAIQVSHVLSCISCWILSITAAAAAAKSLQLCPTLCDPMDCSLRGSSIHGIFQARVLEWVAISFSRGSYQPRDWTWVSRIVGRRFTVWATREVQKQKYRSMEQNRKYRVKLMHQWSSNLWQRRQDYTVEKRQFFFSKWC